MIKENSAMAVAGLSPAATLDDAVARVTEYITRAPETGLIGLVFLNLNQFESALTEVGYRLDVYPLMTNELAQTHQAIVSLKDKRYKLLLHSFGGYVQVINMEPKQNEETPAPPPQYQRRYPWQKTT